MIDVEVCIAGGGLVGLAAAIAFAKQGRQVKLLEAFNLKQASPSELDTRSIALSYSTVQIFQSLGLWHSLREKAAAISNIHVSTAGHFGVTRLTASDLQLDAMGFVIEYHLLISALLDAAEKELNIELITPAKVISVQQSTSSVSIQYDFAGKTVAISAALLVVADGAGSVLREQLGISAETMDYNQTAIITNLKLKSPPKNEGCAFERFTTGGPIALLPLPDQRYALVWTNAPGRTEALMQSSDDEFIQQLYRQFGYRLGLFEQIGNRVRFDLKLTRASQLTTGRAVLIGNAANSLHPVAGQGFNLALRDIGALFDLLSGQDLHSEQLQAQLELYPQKRAADQNQTVSYGNGLVQLFSNNIAGLNHLRAAALAALDGCPVIKQEVSWQGMGYGSGCSSLMRGVSA